MITCCRRCGAPDTPGIRGRVRTVVKNLRRKLGEGAHNPTYVFNEPTHRLPHAPGCNSRIADHAGGVAPASGGHSSCSLVPRQHQGVSRLFRKEFADLASNGLGGLPCQDCHQG